MLLAILATFLFEDLQEDLIYDVLQVWSRCFLVASKDNNDIIELNTDQRHGL